MLSCLLLISAAQASTPAPLPAQLPWAISYATCDACTDPAAAVILPPGAGAPGLPPGYPMAVHADTLGLVDETVQGVVWVAGLFPDMAEAAAWQAQHLPAATVAPLLGHADHRDRLERMYADRELTPIPYRVAVQIHASGGAAAYDREAVTARWQRGAAPEGLSPACTVPDGTVFTAVVEELMWYDWAPVTCPDGTAGVVAWTDTLLAATVFPDGRVRQVVGAECDAPEYAEREY